jgi:putative peptidoglycan binding protein
MKRVLFLTCIGSLALGLTAWGAPKNKSGTKSAKGRSAPSGHVVSAKGGGHRDGGHTTAMRSGGHTASRAATMKTSRGFSGAHARSGAVARAKTLRSSRMEAARSRATLNRERNLARASTPRSSHMEAARTRRAQNLARAKTLEMSRTESARIRDERIARGTQAAARKNLAVNRQRNLIFAHNVLANRAGNARITNYWRTDRFRDPKYAAFYNYTARGNWHDRAWWTSHYSNIVFVLGGWWYWDAGYWYPAWGYDPYAWYWYDGPIYTGYATLAPDRVIVNVQVALRDWGYYAGPTDGVLGPRTRAAVAAFHANHGLAVTSAIDRPTLQTLGLG